MQAEERNRAGTVFAAGGAVMVLMVVLGTFLLVSTGPDGDRPSSITQAVATPEPSTPEGEATPSPTAAPAPEQRVCWDDTEVRGKQTCPVDVEDAQFWAFGLDRADCRPGRASSHAQWSYECTVRGVDVHVASWNSAADRAERLGTYGVQKPTGGGRVLAGGPATEAGRWLRSYDDAWAAKGLLMYASVDAADPADQAVLLGLRQRFPDRILQGEPVVVD